MLQYLVRTCLQRPRIIAVLAAVLLVVGGLFLTQAPYDVFPDFVPAQVEVQTEAPGLTAEQVEQLVSRPVEQSINGAAGVQSVRSQSIQGLSIVKVIFKDGSEPYRARQIVAEALSEASAVLPAGVSQPKVSPLTSSTMDLLKIGFVSDRMSPAELRDYVQWTVRPRLLSIPGVANALMFGGDVRRIEVTAKPDELASRGLGMNDLIAAVQGSTAITGGGLIDTAEQRILVEPHGQAMTADKIAAAQVPNNSGTVIHVGDVANVSDGAEPAFGDAVIMGKPGVLLGLTSQYGAYTLTTTRSVETVVAELKPTFSKLGIRVYDRLQRPANFIETALNGITEDLLIGAALIAIILFLFMRNLRTVLISFVSIPLSLLATMLVLDRLGMSINTMTLGGLAVALGVVVDDAVIDVENIVRRLRQSEPGSNPIKVILNASLEVRSPVIYATLVVAMILVPVIFMHGLQGAFFSPLATAFILATLISLVVAMTVTPALSLLLLRKTHLPEEPRVLQRLKVLHEKLLVGSFNATIPLLIASAVVTVLALGGMFVFNTELLPSFKEGHYVIQIAAQPGTGLGVSRRYGEEISKELLAVPGIASVEQAIGRSEGGEDTYGPEKSEFHVELQPHLSASRQAEVQEGIEGILKAYPGLQTEVLTFLGDRIGDSITGQTASLAINIYGADNATLESTAREVAETVEKVPGTVAVKVVAPPKTPAVQVEVDPAAAADHGLSPLEVLKAVQTAYQGADAAQIYKNDRIVNVAVTLPVEYRQSPEAVGELLLRGNTGTIVQLKDVAQVYLGESRSVIAHNGGQLVQTVTTNPPPAQAARVTKAVQAAVARMSLPKGVYLEYASVAGEASKARLELLLYTSLAVAGIIGLLVLAFHDFRAVLLIIGSTPFALVGGVVAVAVTGATLSLGSLVGFVTLFGIAARNAILLVSHADQLVTEEGMEWSPGLVLTAARERVTPILMTALVTALGLLPLAIETGQAGREIQGPMAIVILGGLITSTAMSLIVLPALIWKFRRK